MTEKKKKKKGGPPLAQFAPRGKKLRVHIDLLAEEVFCGNCRWWWCYDVVADSKLGQCRRWPPRPELEKGPLRSDEGHWPDTFEYSWCGEWARDVVREDRGAPARFAAFTAGRLGGGTDETG